MPGAEQIRWARTRDEEDTIDEEQSLEDMRRLGGSFRRLAWYVAFAISVAMLVAGVLAGVSSVVLLMLVAGVPGALVTFGATARRRGARREPDVERPSRTGLWVLVLVLLLGAAYVAYRYAEAWTVGTVAVGVWVAELMIARELVRQRASRSTTVP